MTSEEEAAFREALQFATNLPPAFLTCRRNQHAWEPFEGWENVEARTLTEVFKCFRCGTKRTQEITIKFGIIMASHYTYPEDYLANGQGRMTGEARGALRIAAYYANRGKKVPKR